MGRVIMSKSKIFLTTWLRLCFRLRASSGTMDRSESLKASPHKVDTNAGFEIFFFLEEKTLSPVNATPLFVLHWSRGTYLEKKRTLPTMQARELAICLFLKTGRVQYTVRVGTDDQLTGGYNGSIQTCFWFRSFTIYGSLPHSIVA
jgi:hypothetical protein